MFASDFRAFAMGAVLCGLGREPDAPAARADFPFPRRRGKDARVSSSTSPSGARGTFPADRPLPVAVIGCGRMGRLHARVLSEMPGVRLVGVCDTSPAAAAAAAEAYGCPAFDGPGALPGGLAAVTVAVPTESHAEVAVPFLERGVACLIEKPLAKSAEEGRRIVEAARRSGATVQVGHIERFNPAVRAMDRLGVRPRFIEVTRISPMTFRSMDVGVVLDVMIHDIDIVLRLAGSTPERVDAVGVNVIGPHEDICNARVTFANGCVANLTASRLAMRTERKLRAFSPDAYVSLDYQKKYGIVIRRSGNLDAIRDAAARIRAGEVADLSDLNYADLVQVQELEIDDVEPARAQMEAFVAAVRDGSRPVVSAEDGLAAVELAARIVAVMPEPNLK
jgi:predicted dehydrogenase